MTRKLNHIVSAGVQLRLVVNGNEVKDHTVPAGMELLITAREVAFFEPGDRLEVFTATRQVLDYTVPPGHAVIIETEQRKDRYTPED